MTLQIINNRSLLRNNTLGLESIAEYFCEVQNTEQLKEVLGFARSKKLTITVLGAGSNVVLKNKLSGLVIIINFKGVHHNINGNHVTLSVAAGEDWSKLVEYALRNNWYGIENLALIPGSVGAAPIQNIGAYGVELSDVFVSLDALDLRTGEVNSMSHELCEFGYRDSIFKKKGRTRFIIIEVKIKLSLTANVKCDYPLLRDALEVGMQKSSGVITPHRVARTVSDIRKKKLPDPSIIANVGSFFKNPILNRDSVKRFLEYHPAAPVFESNGAKYKLSAGWLIERCGLKGFRSGNVGMSSEQALVLVNYGNATSRELLQFSESVKQRVLSVFEISLELEPSVYGSF
ncbi:MAG: UDP-N-acetylenolpyruvoylglucosamine reductase [Cellvibrionales bacterium TMED49]|nr:MAG: UDP-N-acetylenolpyruvoylglucosamine reductase [Cellvibrionales bacterium TMED49]